MSRAALPARRAARAPVLTDRRRALAAVGLRVDGPVGAGPDDDRCRRLDALQRLFLDHVGVGPKWVIRRYRLQEAIERAADGPLDWAAVAADLGYSDQAHLAREFTAVTGVSPAAYARSLE